MAENHEPVREITEVFSLLCDLVTELNVAPLNAHPGCWVHKLDKHWIIAVNAHNEELQCDVEGTMGWRIEPYHAAVWFNGWAAGCFNPYNGWIAAGDAANEAELIEVLKEAIGKAKEAKAI